MMAEQETQSGEVRQVLHEDQEALFAFFDQAYPGRSRFKYPERWQWMYIDNPAIPSGFGIPAWIALLDGRIVGHTGAMLCNARIGRREYLAGWSIDTIVLPEARGTGLGKRLQAANQNAHACFMSLSMSPANRAIKRKLGAFEGPKARLYYRPTRIDTNLLLAGVARRFGGAGALGVRFGQITGLAGLVGRGLQRRLQKVRSALSSPQGLRLEQITASFNEDAQRLSMDCTEGCDFIVPRTPEYLDWKYVRQPHFNPHFFAILREDRMVGVVVARICDPPEPRIGIIHELFLAKPERGAAPAAVALVTTWLEDQGAIGVYFASCDDQDMPGFHALSEETVMYHLSEGTTGMRFAAPWLTLGDHDWDQVPNTRQPSVSEFRGLLRRGRNPRHG